MSLLRCLFCQHVNPLAAAYCNACGSQLDLQPCAVCGAIGKRGARDCYKCGAEFPPVSEPELSADLLADEIEAALAELDQPLPEPLLVLPEVGAAGDGADNARAPGDWGVSPQRSDVDVAARWAVPSAVAAVTLPATPSSRSRRRRATVIAAVVVVVIVALLAYHLQPSAPVREPRVPVVGSDVVAAGKGAAVSVMAAPARRDAASSAAAETPRAPGECSAAVAALALCNVNSIPGK